MIDCPIEAELIEYLLNRSLVCKRKQKQTSHSPPFSKEPQVAKWLLAALLFFDSVPHNSLKFDRGLWGTLSNFINDIVTPGRKKSKKCKKPQVLIFCWIIRNWEPYIAEYP